MFCSLGILLLLVFLLLLLLLLLLPPPPGGVRRPSGPPAAFCLSPLEGVHPCCRTFDPGPSLLLSSVRWLLQGGGFGEVHLRITYWPFELIDWHNGGCTEGVHRGLHSGGAQRTGCEWVIGLVDRVFGLQCQLACPIQPCSCRAACLLVNLLGCMCFFCAAACKLRGLAATVHAHLRKGPRGRRCTV